MSNVKWTDEQKQAIYEKNTNILVAAAAGSGKTAVLVERIINKIINDNVDIDKLLVVTFTNAAASEMKQRVLDAIYKKLNENPENENLQKQILLLNKANICTIDSFCLDVVRNNFFELKNVSPNFRIADTAEIDILEQEVIENIFEQKYDNQDKDFLELINTYTSYKDDSPLKDLILKIVKEISSMPFPEKWLDEHIEMFNLENRLEDDFSNTPWGHILLEDIEEEITDDLEILKNLKKELQDQLDLEKVQIVIGQDINNLEILKANINNWDKAFTTFQTMTFEKWPRINANNEFKEEAKEIRDSVKKKFKAKLEKILLSDSKQSNLDIYDMYKILKKLQNLILEFKLQFSKKKQEKNIVDFSDIEHFALEILLKEDDNNNLVKTDVAKRYQEKFVEIAIDEYQDSNLVQEYIMTAISNGKNLFMVGDVKQSIYKFRQAMPELFLSKYNTYKNTITNNDDNLKIQLFKNFRSRENILDFTNLIFQNIMSENLGNVNYNHEEYLNLGATDYKKPEQNLNTEVYLIDTKEKQDEEEQEEHYEDIELEAKFVAKKIKELIDNKFQVYDRKKECFRDIKYSDIAILLRSTKQKANIFEQEIINQKMDVFSDTSQEYLDSIEIQTIISLLKIIDNPMQDIPLVTVLRSNIGKFTDNDLVTIRLNDKYDDFYTCLLKSRISVEGELKEKIETFLSNLKMWQEEQEYLALDELIWKIYSDTGFYNYCGLMPNGNLRQANLRALFERAKQYEQASFKGLYNFIKFIDKLKLGSGDLGSAKLIGENDNVIRIMSIHKSKGLEFPVVFLANVGKQFNMQSLKIDPILLHSKLGIGMKYINHNIQVEYDTNAKIAVKNKLIQESISEEMRVLYVALTRAKEKLIITGISKDYEKDIEKIKKQVQIYGKVENKINPILLKKCKSYLDWIMLVSVYNKFDFEKIANIEVLEKNKLNTNSKEEVVEKINIQEKLSNNKQDEKKLKQIKEEIEYKYKFIQSSITPTKTSVSEIKLNNQEKINSIELTKPKFINNDEEKQVSPARKGSLVHMCMQYLNPKIDYLENNVKELINNLYEKNIITLKEMQAINPFKILQFTKSKIWQQMKTATKIYREKPFYIEVEANKINSNNNLDKVLVQGIIDLYYITKDDELVLVDYKTDYVQNDEELISKYKVQLDLYKVALEQALQRKVDKIYIYSVYLNKEIDINL